jgi:hypothetical protein
MKPGIESNHNEQGHPELVTQILEHPITHEQLRQEIRFDAAGEPEAMYIFDEKNVLLAYTDGAILKSKGLDQVLTDELAILSNVPKKEKGIGPLHL